MAQKQRPEKKGARSLEKKRLRSPNYPAVGLRSAVERVAQLYRADGRAGAPFDVAIKRIGFKQAHGQARAVLSAMRKFGLVHDVRGRVAPTQDAIDIVEFPDGHERRSAALRKAALSPDIYSDLVRHFADMGSLPSDESLKPELLADRQFNPKVVDSFLTDFRQSLEYAGILAGSELVVRDVGERSDAEASNGGPAPFPVPTVPLESSVASTSEDPVKSHLSERHHKSSVRREKGEGPYVYFPLTGNNSIEIILKQKVSASEFETIKKLIDLSEAVLVKRLNQYMLESLESGEAVDVRERGEEIEPGVFRLRIFNKATQLDYCDAKNQAWIWSIGRDKQTGEILAATDGRFYSDETGRYDCVWLR
jgi:hypothetical protein